MLTFLLALFGFLVARILWSTVKHFARQCNELPIVWFTKTVLILAGLAITVGGTLGFFLYAFSVITR
jgi:hypothetical protein